MNKTARFLFSALTLIGSSLVGALAQSNEPTVHEFIIVPEVHSGDKQSLLAMVGTRLESLGPADDVIFVSGSGEVIAQFEIPNQPRYGRFEYIEDGFQSQITALESYLVALHSTPAVSPVDVQLDIPLIAERIAELRELQVNPAKTLLIGSPLMLIADDPSASMINSEGELVVASDGLLLGSKLLSPYGLGKGDDHSLSEVSVHFCALIPEGTPQFEKAQLKRQWVHFFALRGSVLSTFTESIETCHSRYERDIRTAIEVDPLQEDTIKAMVLASRAEDLSEVIVDERKAVSDQLTERRRDNSIRAEEAVAALEESEARRLTAETALNDCREGESDRDATIAELEEQLADYEKVFASNPLDGLTSFSRFRSVLHPSIGDQLVYTGTDYEAKAFPDYQRAYCYLIRLSNDGVQIRVELGSKARGHNVNWKSATSSILNAAGLSRKEFLDARQSCRFPED